MATTVSLLIRAVPAEIHRPAKARAAAEGRSLQWLVVTALREYGAGLWTPTAMCPTCGEAASEQAPSGCRTHLV